MEEEIPRLESGIFREDDFTIDNSSENYIIKIQNRYNETILISVKKDNHLNNSIYEKEFSINDFQIIFSDLIIIFKKKIENIYNFLKDSFKENNVSIGDIIKGNSLTLSTTLEITGQDPFKINIELPENRCNTNELIDHLCNEINIIKEKNKNLEKENIDFKEEITLIKNEMNKIKEDNDKLKKLISNKKDIKIQSGDYYANFVNKYPDMYTKHGSRKVTIPINFDEKYDSIPHVMVSLSGIDGLHTANTRIMVYAKNVNTSRFDIDIETWYDSALYTVKISWISFG